MGIQELQTFLESANVPGGCVPVDLLRIARNNNSSRQSNNKQQRGKNTVPAPTSALSLVVDGEYCLDRLYGGFFSDWACGGQWNRMVQFLAVLIQTVQGNNIQLAFFFNGAVETQRMSEWIAQQMAERQKINHVLRHVNMKGTPPPKIWWTQPVCLKTCLRMALRHLGVGLMCTMDDHHQEVIAYCRENSCSGLMADDGEYAVFDPPRYFSSESLKLTYKGSLETKEFVLSEVTKLLGLSTERMCVLGALLGNYVLSEADLADVYARLGIKEPSTRVPTEQPIRVLAAFVKGLPSVDNLDTLTEQVLGSATDKRAARFQQSVKYYMNGTKDGFLSYKPQHSARRPEKGAASVKAADKTDKTASDDGGKKDDSLDYSRLASETMESEQESLARYQEATARSLPAPQIVIEPPTGLVDPVAPQSKLLNGTTLQLSSSSSSSSSNAPSPSRLTPDAPNGSAKQASDDDEKAKPAWLLNIPHEVMRTTCERHEKGLMSPLIYQIFTQGEIKLPVLMEEESHREVPNIHLMFRPIRQMVYAVLFNVHHHKYLASKSNGAKDNGAKDNGAKDNGAKDNKSDGDSPPRPQGKDPKEAYNKEVANMTVKEWVWSKENAFRTPHQVVPEQLGWGVPTIQRLWFGSSLDDKKRRFRAFLTCMKSDSALMMNPAYVPQHLLVMATVLRYIMSYKGRQILRKPELDAFIATAFSPDLMNAQYQQDLQLPMVSGRGVQLAAMFMSGVENALLANDACGAPLPWLMCCPWLYFDGKLFHHNLARTAVVKNLLELCDRRIDLVVKVERMRKAVLEGLDVQFSTAQPAGRHPADSYSFPPGLRIHPANCLVSLRANGAANALHDARTGVPGYPMSGRGMKNFGFHPLNANGSAFGAAAAFQNGAYTNGTYGNAALNRGGLIRRSVPARGGQLEVAGVVVGQWGANYGSRGGHVQKPQSTARQHFNHHYPPQVTSVGGLKNYRGGAMAHAFGRSSYGPGRGARPAVGPTRAAKKNSAARKKKGPKQGKGRGLTVEVANGDAVTVGALSVIPTPLETDEDSYTETLATLSGQFEDAVNLNAIAANLKAGDIVNGFELGQGDAKGGVKAQN